MKPIKLIPLFEHVCKIWKKRITLITYPHNSAPHLSRTHVAKLNVDGCE